LIYPEGAVIVREKLKTEAGSPETPDRYDQPKGGVQSSDKRLGASSY
jgi:hypothetical protein